APFEVHPSRVLLRDLVRIPCSAPSAVNRKEPDERVDCCDRLDEISSCSTGRLARDALSPTHDVRWIQLQTADLPGRGSEATHSTGGTDSARQISECLCSAHPVVARVVLDLGLAELLEKRRHVHAEPSAQALLEAVPAA